MRSDVNEPVPLFHFGTDADVVLGCENKLVVHDPLPACDRDKLKDVGKQSDYLSQ